MPDDPIIGHTIQDVRYMTDEELEAEDWGDWGGRPVVLVLDNGAKLYPSQDPEGNGPGAMFGADDDGFFRVRPRG